VQGYSATAAGAAFLPFIVIMFTLSRWSGGLVDRFGARLPLVIGPLVAAVGFAMFAWPARSHNYWTSFFPAVVVLGFGMAVSVAPLTTTVMSSVKEQQAGVASGINNAVSRMAGLLAIAIFGVMMLQTFSRNLDRGLVSISARVDISEDVRHSIADQRVKLAGLELPANLTPELQSQLAQAVGDAFISGFRLIMLSAAALAMGSALSAWLLIKDIKSS
jgi:MFS family permease